MSTFIQAVSHALPEGTLTNVELSRQFPAWTPDQIVRKTGIASRRVAGAEEWTSDLAAAAANRLFTEHAVDPQSVDYLILCTQSPDYPLPATACLLQARLGLRKSAGALDMNLGCSGFVYGLGLAKGLIETGQVSNVLFLTADTYSKFLHPEDKGTRTIFGDGAAATLVARGSSTTGDLPHIGPFVYGTDGTGSKHLMVKHRIFPQIARSPGGDDKAEWMRMDGPEVFNFTIKVVPEALTELWHRADIGPESVDLFVFHQANRYMLEYLRDKLRIPPEKFPVCLEDCGNTVSSTIPITLQRCVLAGQLRSGMTVAVVGFGVGLSWAATLIRWR